MAKIEDFGVHANAYYPLDVSYFKSSLDDSLLDLLWNKYDCQCVVLFCD
jgi:COP9 signalosome complex subunit 5